MKIAFVADALNVGGMETYLFAFAKRAEAEGHDVSIVTTEAIGKWHSYFVMNGLRVECVLPDRTRSRRHHSRRVAEILNRFDLLLLNHCAGAQSAIGLLAADKVAISVLHNDDDPIYAVGLAGLANLDQVVAVSDAVRSKAISRGAPPEMIACIRNGVVVPPFIRPPLAGAGPGIKLIFIGRINHQQKGVLYLPGIVSKLIRKGITFSLDIIGDGAGDYGQLRFGLAEAEREGRVRFHGSLPPDETMAILEKADALLMPSHFEGQGLVMLEAMARGVVPVVSRLAGVTDSVVCEGVDGFLVPVGDEAAFAEAIVALTEEGRLKAMSQAASETARGRFSIESMAAAYLQLFRHCLVNRRGGKAAPRTGELDLKLLGKRSGFPLVLHDLSDYFKGLLKRECK